VLVLAGVLGFPLLFDTQPRPVSMDVAIVIPDKNRAAPLAVPETAPVLASASMAPDEEVVVGRGPTPAPGPGASASAATASESAAAPVGVANDVPKAPKNEGPKEVSKAEPSTEAKAEAKAKAEPKPEPKPVQQTPVKPEAKAETKPEPKPAASSARTDEAARALALLEGKSVPDTAPPAAPVEAARYIVQVGAFSDVNKAREVRQKLEKAGLKTYTQVVDTADGKRVRVRVGPFATKSEVDRAAGRIRALELPTSVLTL
jgi:DedD protein